MIKIDGALLQEIGLGSLSPADRDSLLKHIYETLEMRVGMRLADQMTNQQLDEFEQYFEAKDDKGAFKWLETNFPNYKDIVQEEFDKLKIEIGNSAPQILAAAGPTESPQSAPVEPVNNASFAASPSENVTPPQPNYQPTPPAPQPQAYPQAPTQPAPPDYYVPQPQSPPIGPAGPYVPYVPKPTPPTEPADYSQ